MSCGQPGPAWSCQSCQSGKNGSRKGQSNFWTAVPPEECTPNATTDPSTTKPPTSQPDNDGSTGQCGSPYPPKCISKGPALIGPSFDQLCRGGNGPSPPKPIDPFDKWGVPILGPDCGCAPGQEDMGSPPQSACNLPSTPLPLLAGPDCCGPNSSPKSETPKVVKKPVVVQPPSPGECQKFQQFAQNGIPEAERPRVIPEKSDKDKDVSIIGRLSQNQRCRQEGEKQEVIDQVLDRVSQNCADDGREKTDTFEVDCFVCPPMPTTVPPVIVPGWLQCPAKVTVHPYPVPPGVKIKAMSKGIRTNVERNPTCGTCGARRKVVITANKDCPAVRTKSRCPPPGAKTEKKKELWEDWEGTLKTVTGKVKSVLGLK